jgi:hypothetical protein
MQIGENFQALYLFLGEIREGILFIPQVYDTVQKGYFRTRTISLKSKHIQSLYAHMNNKRKMKKINK